MEQQSDPLALPSPTKMLGDLHRDVKTAQETMKWLKSMATEASLAIAMTLSTTVEVFVRTNFGERYLSLGRIAATFITLQVIAAIMLAFTGPRANAGSGALVTAFLLAAIIQRIQIMVRNRRGIRWHSRCFGESFLLMIPWPESWRMSQWRVAFIVEPVVVLVIGYLLSGWEFAVGVAVMGGGVAMLSVTVLHYQKYRNALLDRIDAQIESEMFSEALEGKPLKETKGFVVPGASQLSKAAVDLQQATEGLDPGLREILEPKVDGVGAGPGVASAFGDVSGTTDGSPGEAESAPPRSSS